MLKKGKTVIALLFALFWVPHDKNFSKKLDVI